MKKGKIIKGIAGFYYVHDGYDNIYECKAKGIFRNRKVKPLVGDWVDFEVLDEEKGLGNIIEIFPRKNLLVRPAVANVDQAFVIFAVKEPAPNLNLLDRFLVMMEMQEVSCHICFNKVDLDESSAKELMELYKKAGYPFHLASTYTKAGISELSGLLRGQTTVFAGPSGVGKSSLINLLHPKAKMETGRVSEKNRTRAPHHQTHGAFFPGAGYLPSGYAGVQFSGTWGAFRRIAPVLLSGVFKVGRSMQISGMYPWKRAGLCCKKGCGGRRHRQGTL